MSDDTSTTSTNRKRSANTTLAERELLIDLVACNADVIECKRTDGRTAQEKDLAWAAVAEQFNAVSATKRDVRQLKQVISSISVRIHGPTALCTSEHNQCYHIILPGGRISNV